MGIDSDDFGKVNNGVPGGLKPWEGGFTPVRLTDKEKQQIPDSHPAVGPLVPIELDDKPKAEGRVGREELMSQGEALLQNITDSVYDTENRLRLGAEHYLHNYDRISQNGMDPGVDVGVMPVADTLNNGLVGDSEHSVQMRDISERVHQGIDGVLADFAALTNISGPNGRSANFYEEVSSLYRQMTSTENEDEARHIADQIQEKIRGVKETTLADTERVNSETQSVEGVTTAENEALYQWRREYAERSNGAGVETLNSFQGTLGRLAETSRIKGEDFRDSLNYVPQMVEDIDGQWQKFAERYFGKEE